VFSGGDPALISRLMACACLAACVLFPAASSAQLVIDRLWVDLGADGAGREDITLGNESRDRYFVTLKVSEIVNPGTPDERREEIADPESLGLLVSPTRLILEPGATRAVRVVSINDPPEKDRIYRLMITPQISDVDAPAAAEGEHGVNIRILMAYDVLIVARPADPEPRIARVATDGGFALRNQGNTSVLLTDGKVCPPNESSSCKPLQDARLYAGGELRIDTDVRNADISYRQRILAKGDSRTTDY
jgi:P pilus assembly chaperone PapD